MGPSRPRAGCATSICCASAVVALACSISACEGPQSPAGRGTLARLEAPSSPSPPAPESGRTRLERIVLAVGPRQLRDECLVASVWSHVDAPAAGKVLDDLVEWYASRPGPLDARSEVACYPSAVQGRLVRKSAHGPARHRCRAPPPEPEAPCRGRRAPCPRPRASRGTARRALRPRVRGAHEGLHRRRRHDRPHGGVPSRGHHHQHSGQRAGPNGAIDAGPAPPSVRSAARARAPT